MTDKPPPFLLHPHQAAMLEALRTGTGAITMGIDPGSGKGDLTAIYVTAHLREFNGGSRMHRGGQDLPLAERVDGVPSFLCPRCGAESFNPKDIQHRYCGRCHVFVDDEIARDLAKGGLPLAERVDGKVDGWVDEAAEIKREAWDALLAAPPGLALRHLPEALRQQAPPVDGDAITRDVLMPPLPEPVPLIREAARRIHDRWWADFEADTARRVRDRLHFQLIEQAQADPAYQRMRDELLLVLLAHRADATRHPGRLQIDAFWQWREACIRGQREANWIGRARGGFPPSPVRWICTVWREPEPRRSRMLGLLPPWDFGGPRIC